MADKLISKNKITLINTERDILDTGFEFIYNLDRNKNNKKIGIKMDSGKLFIATNCVKNRNYNSKNYKNYYGLYLGHKIYPIIENLQDIININNDNRILKITNKSEIYIISKK